MRNYEFIEYVNGERTNVYTIEFDDLCEPDDYLFDLFSDAYRNTDIELIEKQPYKYYKFNLYNDKTGELKCELVVEGDQ